MNFATLRAWPGPPAPSVLSSNRSSADALLERCSSKSLLACVETKLWFCVETKFIIVILRQNYDLWSMTKSWIMTATEQVRRQTRPGCKSWWPAICINMLPIDRNWSCCMIVLNLSYLSTLLLSIWMGSGSETLLSTILATRKRAKPEPRRKANILWASPTPPWGGHNQLLLPAATLHILPKCSSRCWQSCVQGLTHNWRDFHSVINCSAQL